MKNEWRRYITEIATRWKKVTPPSGENKSSPTITGLPTNEPAAGTPPLPIATVEIPEVVQTPVFKPLKLPETAERPYDFLVVVADDRLDEVRTTVNGARFALGAAENPSIGVREALDSLEFFNTALRGKRGGQADIALVDHDYSGDYERRVPRWNLDPRKIAHLARTLGQDFKFTPEEKERVDGTHYYSVNGVRLYNPNSVNYSLLLRALGFKGKIYVVSNAPPQPARYTENIDKIRRVDPSFHSGNPIDGVIHKGSFKLEWGGRYATEIGEDGRWNFVNVQESETAATLKSLLKG